jgi:hypothetical protein
MAMDVLVTGTNLDTYNNIKTNLPTVSTQAGYAMLSGELAEPTDPVGRIVNDIRTSAQGRLGVGSPIILLNSIFSGSLPFSNDWVLPTGTMTIVAGTNTINLNAGLATASTNVARMTTVAFFPFLCDLSTFAVWEMLHTQTHQANCVTEAGFFQCISTTAPTDGAFFRYSTSGGTLQAVLSNQGTEQSMTISPTHYVTGQAYTIPAPGVMHKYKIICENDRVLYYINGICVATISSAGDAGMPMNAGTQPFSIRTYNNGVPSLANIIKVGYVCIGCQDSIGLGLSQNELASIAGKSLTQGQTGQATGSTAYFSNSMVLGAGAVLTNTTSVYTGLGGQFTIQPTLAAGTDGILCSFVNTTPTATVPAKVLLISGVKIQGMVTAALTGGPGVIAYSLAYGHSALSLATTENINTPTKAPRRIALGLDTFAATAAIGATNPTIYMPFTVPIAVMPGEYIAIVAKFLAGTIFSGTTGLITYIVTFDGKWV